VEGEDLEGTSCVVCPNGKYTFAAGSQNCYDCFSNAECKGGNIINVDSGYWR